MLLYEEVIQRERERERARVEIRFNIRAFLDEILWYEISFDRCRRRILSPR